MPTGYTSALYDGPVDFKKFALRCATAFFHDMHELPEEISPPTFYLEKIEELRAELVEVQSWDEAAADRQAHQTHREAYQQWLDDEEKVRMRSLRYRLMLAQVSDWQPPTPEHEPLKQLMVDQLQQSLDFDCGSYPPPKRLSGADYRRSRLADIHRHLGRHRLDRGKAIDAAREQNDWILALRQSLETA